MNVTCADIKLATVLKMKKNLIGLGPFFRSLHNEHDENIRGYYLKRNDEFKTCVLNIIIHNN